MAVDIPAPHITRTLTMQYKLILDFHKEGFRLPVPSQRAEMIQNANVVTFMVSKLNSATQL